MMTLHDLLWIDESHDLRTTYHHNAIALLVFAFGVVPAFGGFGYAELFFGWSWLHLLWQVPGVLIWSAALLYVLAVMRRRLEPVPPIYSDPPYEALFVDKEYCTHEYPDGAAYCIYCGMRRTPATRETIKL